MNCSIFKETYIPLKGDKDKFLNFLNHPLYEEWFEHMDICLSCEDWYLEQTLDERNINFRSFPCVHLAYRAHSDCEQHPNPWDCPDNVIVHFDKKKFGIPVRCGENASASSMIQIKYCPWCGKKIPEAI